MLRFTIKMKFTRARTRFVTAVRAIARVVVNLNFLFSAYIRAIDLYIFDLIANGLILKFFELILKFLDLQPPDNLKNLFIKVKMS